MVTSSCWALTLHASFLHMERLQELCVTLCRFVLFIVSLNLYWTKGLTIHKGIVTLNSLWEAVTVHASWFCDFCLEQLNELCLTACYSGPSIKTCPLSRTKVFTIHKDKLAVASSQWAVTLQRSWFCLGQLQELCTTVQHSETAIDTIYSSLTKGIIINKRCLQLPVYIVWWLCMYRKFVWSNCKISVWLCVTQGCQ